MKATGLVCCRDANIFPGSSRDRDGERGIVAA